MLMENIYNIKSIGRSEDFVEIKEACFVDLKDVDAEVEGKLSAYLDYELVKQGIIGTHKREGIAADGTKYYINKNYEPGDSPRIFHKKKVVYTSEYYIDEPSENVFLDRIDDEVYIVNFI